MIIHLRPQKYGPGPWHIELVNLGSLMVLQKKKPIFTTFTTRVIIYTVS